MYYNFVDLSDASPNIQEAVEDMQMLVDGSWNFAERVDTNRMLDIFNNFENILAEIVTMPSDDKKMFLLKMAACRFCIVYLPQIMKVIEEEEKEAIIGGLLSGKKILPVALNDDSMKQWEKGFWGDRMDHFYSRGYSGEAKIFLQREEFRKKKPVKESDYVCSPYDCIPKTIEKAYEDAETIHMVKELEKKYKILVDEVKSRNVKMKSNTAENKKILLEIHELGILAEVMERDLKGELTVKDIMKIREKKGEWMESIQNVENFFSDLE